jgi:hypothetical protein
MNINAISESIKELLAEQNHDVTTITIRSMMNRIIALNNIVEQFVNVVNQNEVQSTELGVSNTEVLQLHQFAEYIARLDDTDFNTNLDECKLVSRVQLIHTLNAIEGMGKLANSLIARDKIEINYRHQELNTLVNEMTMQVRRL